MPPNLTWRGWNEDPPDYVFNVGGNSDLFSVEVCHNGFFCGLRKNLSYVCASTDVFDNCSAQSWSAASIDEILIYLGYQRDGILQVYWCLPGKDITDGLVPVVRDAHFAEMVKLSKSHKTLVLFFDHKNFLRNFIDDVILTEGSFIPGVISPRKVPWKSNIVADQVQPNEVLEDHVHPNGGLADQVQPIIDEVLEDHAQLVGGLAEKVQPIVDDDLEEHVQPIGGLAKQVQAIIDEVLEDHAQPVDGLAEQVQPIVDDDLEEHVQPVGGLAEQVQPIVDEVLEEHVQQVQVDDSESDTDCSIYDSDYDAEDGDDDLSADYVDTEVNDHNEKEIVQENEDDEALEDEDLNLIGEEREKLQHKIRSFNPEVDMDNPIFKIGMVLCRGGKESSGSIYYQKQSKNQEDQE